jgi:hypothetical protein
MKYLKIGPYEIGAFVIIVFAALLRIVLAALGWPLTNSDEGTMGLMAMHIAYRGEHPMVFYGQNYMGSLEAYLGAISFHLFGVSVFTLRLGVILLFTLFLISIYLLTCLLFSKKLGLVTLVLLSVGSVPILTREMIATGGSTQTLLFGCLAFLFASWLALSFTRTRSPHVQLLRFLTYSCWGLVVGAGLWSDMVVVPFLAMSGLLLILFCWRELWSLAPLFLLLGLVIGAFPLLYYNINVLHGLNSANVLLGLFHGSGAQAARTLPQIFHNIKSTIQVSIPTATGEPFCPVLEEYWLGDNSPHTLTCTITHSIWGFGYILLLIVAILLTGGTIWKLRQQAKFEASLESHRDCSKLKRSIIHLILLISAALDVIIFTFSSAPVDMPGYHARYLVGLLIITPAIIAPLWHGIGALKWSRTEIGTRPELMKTIVCRCILSFIFIIFFIGTIIAYSEIPVAQASNQQEESLIHDLLHIGVTHIYTEYWTCDKIAFVSREQITCAVLNNDLQVDMFHNRYTPYVAVVQADPNAAYVCPINFSPATAMKIHLEQKAKQPGSPYRFLVFDGYIVLQPIRKG